MPIDLGGLKGELRAAGRWVATLGNVSLHVSPSEAMSAGGRLLRSDSYWLEHATGVTLMLQVGQRRWQWRDVNVAIAGSTVTVSGQGRPTII